MRAKNLSSLDFTTLDKLEKTLDAHTRQRIAPDRWSEFSWSISRHGMFDSCKRQYYLNYYGARRVREANNELISAVWWLKQGVSLKMWIGSVIHATAQRAIKAHYDGKPIPADTLTQMALSAFDGGYKASERAAKYENQWVVLMEHLYPQDADLSDLALARQTVQSLMQSFLTSTAYNLILSLPPASILEIDESFQSFEMQGTPVLESVRIFAIPDVLLSHDGRLTIIDWKTGDVERDSIRWQAGVYSLYAHEAYKVPLEAIDVWIVDLANGGETVQPPGGVPSLAESREFITQSIAAMVEQMDYPVYNTVAIDQFPMTDDLSMCQSCPFKRACWRHIQPTHTQLSADL